MAVPVYDPHIPVVLVRRLPVSLSVRNIESKTEARQS